MGSNETGPIYRDFIRFRSHANPCLTRLSEYIGREDTKARTDSKIVVVDYPSDSNDPTEPRDVTEDELPELLGPEGPRLRVLLVEDIQPRLIELLGSTLEIDPLFFAGHIIVEFRNLEQQPAPPSLALFPSNMAERGYLHVHYQQVVDLGQAPDKSAVTSAAAESGYFARAAANAPRDTRFLPLLSGRQVGLLRRVCSLLMTKIGNQHICLILVDPPVRGFKTPGMTGAIASRANCRALNGGYEAFATPMSFGEFKNMGSDSGLPMIGQRSMLSDIVEYLRSNATTLQSQDQETNIIHFGAAPMRIALAEWMTYVQLTSRFVKYYEYSLQGIHNRVDGRDIVDLQRWRRRLQQSQHKLVLMSEFVTRWMPGSGEEGIQVRSWETILRDISFVQGKLAEAQHLLEQMIPVATSMAQLLDTQHSILQASGTTRLTYIALIFVPLSWVASLFSMADGYTPGEDRFWVYFATSLPLLVLVLAVATLLQARKSVLGIVQKFLGLRGQLLRKAQAEGVEGA